MLHCATYTLPFPSSHLRMTSTKKLEELTKSHKLSSKVTPKKRIEPPKSQLLNACRVVAALARILVGEEPLRFFFLGSGHGQAQHQQNLKHVPVLLGLSSKTETEQAIIDNKVDLIGFYLT